MSNASAHNGSDDNTTADNTGGGEKIPSPDTSGQELSVAEIEAVINRILAKDAAAALESLRRGVALA